MKREIREESDDFMDEDFQNPSKNNKGFFRVMAILFVALIYMVIFLKIMFLA